MLSIWALCNVVKTPWVSCARILCYIPKGLRLVDAGKGRKKVDNFRKCGTMMEFYGRWRTVRDWESRRPRMVSVERRFMRAKTGWGIRGCFSTGRRRLVCAGVTFGGVYGGGSGSTEDPYRISKVADWQLLMNTSSDWTKNFILTVDLDLSNITVKPIGNNFTPFKRSSGRKRPYPSECHDSIVFTTMQSVFWHLVGSDQSDGID